ncbi:MAG: helicase-related protein [Thermoplasmata archaeon]
MATVDDHPRIRPGVLEDRLYQEHIATTALAHNTLVVLPTGLGKTAVALRVMAEYLRRYPDRSVLLMAPTRPLVVQHGRSVTGTLLAPPPVVLTGTVTPERRAEGRGSAGIVVATPQVIENDLRNGTLDLSTYSLIVFDEAHRAAGDYPYVAIGRANRQGGSARVLAMTASPGSSIDRIREVWENLGIERFEYRTLEDPDVNPYTHGIGVDTVEVPMPAEVRHLAIRLKGTAARQFEILQRHHLLPAGDASRRDLLRVGDRLHQEVAQFRRDGQTAPAGLWSSITAQSVAMKALHATELIESQGVEALRGFLARQTPAKGGRLTPAQRVFLNDPDVVAVRSLLGSMDLEHPKIAKTVELVKQEIAANPLGRVIVFTQYRQTAEVVVQELNRDGDGKIRSARFVGQASHGADEGMSQKDQIQLLDSFRLGAINCIVATSVGEEGLDIPSTDLVIFYEPIPDVIRTIQRRGRTGRAHTGRVVVLIAEGTRDVGLAHVARSRERKMHEMLERVETESAKGELARAPRRAVQHSLREFGG